LDRYNAELAWTVSYVASERLTFGANVGVNYTSFIDDPKPIQTTFIDENGQSQTVIEQKDDGETTLVFGAGMSYLFQPGSTLSLNVAQERSSDIDGQLITTRSFTGNLTKAFGDRLTLVAGGSYLQFSSDDSLSQAIDRVEGSTSLSYLLTQNTSLVLGYSYTKQDVDDDDLEQALRFNTQDYTGNKVYIGLNTGILGLPG
jgi:long-subunit fatty acid transport protein